MALQPAVRVELDIFSGRPNPTWSLTAPEAEELMTRLREAWLRDQAERNGFGSLLAEAAPR